MEIMCRATRKYLDPARIEYFPVSVVFLEYCIQYAASVDFMTWREGQYRGNVIPVCSTSSALDTKAIARLTKRSYDTDDQKHRQPTIYLWR